MLDLVLVGVLGGEALEGPTISLRTSSLPRLLETLNLVPAGGIAVSLRILLSSPYPTVPALPARFFDGREKCTFPSRSLQRLLFGEYISAGRMAKSRGMSSSIYCTRALMTSWHCFSFLASSLAFVSAA